MNINLVLMAQNRTRGQYCASTGLARTAATNSLCVTLELEQNCRWGGETMMAEKMRVRNSTGFHISIQIFKVGLDILL